MAWVERANRHDGAVFRGSDHWGNLDPKSFSAHGLRPVISRKRRATASPARSDAAVAAQIRLSGARYVQQR